MYFPLIMLLHCLSNTMTTRTSILYLFIILHLWAILKYVVAGLKLKATLAEKHSLITRANIQLENYSYHLTVGQAYLCTLNLFSPAPGIRHRIHRIFPLLSAQFSCIIKPWSQQSQYFGPTGVFKSCYTRSLMLCFYFSIQRRYHKETLKETIPHCQCDGEQDGVPQLPCSCLHLQRDDSG